MYTLKQAWMFVETETLPQKIPEWHDAQISWHKLTNVHTVPIFKEPEDARCTQRYS
jgi:hypothetical protein